MTLLAGRRDELARRPTPQKVVEERRAVVRPRVPARGFLHVQAALGNRATGGLLRARGVVARPRGGPPPALPGRGEARGRGVAAVELAPLLGPAAARARPPLPIGSASFGDRRRRPPAEPEAAVGEARARFLVADGAEPLAGQMTRGAFLEAMRRAAAEAAEEGLAPVGQTARGCPWIDHYFHFYRRQSAVRIEADLRRYVPAARGAASAGELLALASEHVRASVARWAATGELAGLPRGLPGMGLVASVRAALGRGRPLPASARSRMERALGTRLGTVRLHTGAAAARLARRLGARAFAVGADVAFGRGEFRPGTPTGDALLAHELAHTVQQRGAGTTSATAVPGRRAEGEAAVASAGALGRLWAGGRVLAGDLARRASPRLRTGLALAACRETFSDQELREYLRYVEASRTWGGFEGDNRARAVVRENLERPGTFPLRDVHVRWMIEEMLEGSTGTDDQKAILELLQQSNAARLEFLFVTAGLTARRLLGKFDGEQERELRAFFIRRFQGGDQALLAGDVRVIPDSDLEVFPYSIDDPERGFRTEDLQRLRERGGSLRFSGSLSPLSADAERLLLDNIAATVGFALDPANPDRIAELAALRRELEEQGPEGQFSETRAAETPAERIDATDLYHGHVCVPQAVLDNSARLRELRAAASAFHDFGPGQSIRREIAAAVGHEGMPTTRPQARRVMAVVERHRVAFLRALGPLLEALMQVPEAGISYHTWETVRPRFGTTRLPSEHPIRHLFTPFSTQRTVFQRVGDRDCAALINFSFHVNRRGEITLLPNSSGETVRAFEILFGWGEAPEQTPPATPPSPAPTGASGGGP